MQTELKAIREQLGYSMSEMAEELQIKKGTLQGYESGRRATPPLTLGMALVALGKVVDWEKRYLPGGECDQIMADVPMFLGERVDE